MSVTVEPAKIGNITRITLSGPVSIEEFMEAIHAYGKKGPAQLEMYDVRELEGERFSAVDIDQLIDYFRRHPDRRPPGSKTAVVVSKTVDVGITRMFSILSDGVVSFEIEAFRSEEEALAWLAPK